MSRQLTSIGLWVSDMARSLAFYRLLGVEIPPEADDQPHVDVRMDGGLLLFWDTVALSEAYDPARPAPAGGSRILIEFMFDTPADVDAKHTELVGAGYASHRDPFDAVWGGRFAMVDDPDGNTIGLTSPQG